MTLKVAMLGTGRIAGMKLLPAIAKSDNVVLWSVLSRDAGRAAELAKQYGAKSPTPGYSDLDAMLADDQLDAIIIATPDKLHSVQAIAAARAGKHVFCEKPMTTSIEEADAMVAACKDTGVKLGVAFHLRWHPGLRKLHNAVANGLLGDLRHMRIQWSFQAPDAENWRAGTDVGRWWGLAGVGTHCLDQILWFMEPHCGEVVEIKSMITRDFFKGPNDETALINLRFANGATADLCSSVLFNAPTCFELYGTKGYAKGEGAVGITGEGRMWTDQGAWEFTPNDPYLGEIEDFAAAVRDDRAPEVDGEMGRKNTAILVQATA
ncbi:MAG: Gfo/Idh/MocA family oxidoreductase [Hyphomicrobiaceae bacterium]|nr:Gfo/Idh/MocA family oxidoreductase [Hyphomicrobiaceae bacterium]